jgi:hypothetical protein
MVRKNKMKKTTKKKKEEEANKVPVITFTVAAVGESIRTGAVQSLLNIFFSYKICVLVRSVALFRISFVYPQWELVVITHFPELVVNVFPITFDIHSLCVSLTPPTIFVSCDTVNSDSFRTHWGVGHLYVGDQVPFFVIQQRAFYV